MSPHPLKCVVKSHIGGNFTLKGYIHPLLYVRGGVGPGVPRGLPHTLKTAYVCGRGETEDDL